MMLNTTLSNTTKPLQFHSSHASHQLFIKLKTVERLVKETTFRHNETNELKEKLAQEEEIAADTHVINRARVLYEEAKATLNVTLLCLERECKETDAYIVERFGEILKKKEDWVNLKEEEDDWVTVTLKKIIDAFNVAVKYLPKLQEELVLLQPTQLPQVDEEEI